MTKLQLESEKVLVRTQVCPVGRNCSEIEARVFVTCKLINDLTGQPFIFSTYASIFDDMSNEEFDIIIGQPTLDEHQVVAKRPYAFGLDDRSILEMAEDVKAKLKSKTSL